MPPKGRANVGSMSESALGNTGDTDAQLPRKGLDLQSVPPLIRTGLPKGTHLMTTAKARCAQALSVGISATLLVLAGCSSSDSSAGDASGAASTGASGEAIVAAADPSLLPYNFLGDDNETWEGINVDLAAVLSEELGLEIVFENASFDAIICLKRPDSVLYLMSPMASGPTPSALRTSAGCKKARRASATWRHRRGGKRRSRR